MRELTNAGYVLTWDARGWYDSHGRCELDSPAYEGRDVSALIDAVAGQPEALPAPHAIDVPVATFPRPGQTGGDVVGAPTLSFAYRARTLHPTRTWLYAQIVDMDSRHVLGDQVAPIPIAVDGAEHSLRLRLGVLAVRVRPASRYVLQVTDASPQFHAPRVLGRVTVSRVVVRLPLVDVPHAPEASTG